MVTVQNSPRPTLRRRRSYEAARSASLLRSVVMLKEANGRRLSVCCGPTMLGFYPPDAIEAALADLSAWAADSGYFTASAAHACAGLEWAWEWDEGEELVLWQAGRIVAIVRKTADGNILVTRFDHT